MKPDLFAPPPPEKGSLLGEFLAADCILVKKLSRNDRDWARLPTKRQYGPYIPVELRDSGLFPPLRLKAREQGADIREVTFETVWPQLDVVRRSRLVNYTSKGSETHLTGVPKAAFSDLSPASYLLVRQRGHESFICMTVDSASEEALLLEEALGLPPDFSGDILRPQEERLRQQTALHQFVEAALAAFLAGEFVTFAARHADMPSTQELATLARDEFLKRVGRSDLNPFKLDAPGDVLRTLSRSIEWDLFRDRQMRAKSLELVSLIVGHDPAISLKQVLRNLIARYEDIDALLLSASQQRKSRAGYSFEHHIESMLLDGQIPHKKQVVMEARKRPDFVLPNLPALRKARRGDGSALILSAKTTLRERWKQVQREKGSSDLFLGTVDENIAGNAIQDMDSLGIVLVVPESLIDADTTEYAGHSNVISFATFFHEELGRRRLSGRTSRWGRS